MRRFVVLSLFIAVHLVPASIDVGNSPNEIPREVKEEYFDNNTSTGYADDLDEVYIFDEDSEYEEVKIISLSRYTQLSKAISADDESQSHISEKDELERSKDSVPKRSPSKVRKKRSLSCLLGSLQTPTFNCDAQSKYRTMDGSCNNLEHPDWGMAMTCQERFLPANYYTPITTLYTNKSDFRRSVKGGPLTKPRQLSINIFLDEIFPDPNRTHMCMFFGQIVAHDLVLTPSFALNTGEVLPCCQPEYRKDDRCADIRMKKNDTFYGPLNQTCMDFTRSVGCNSCGLEGRKVINLVTQVLDCSFIYESSENTSRFLRTLDGTGMLKYQVTEQGQVVPINSTDPEHDQCSNLKTGDLCYQSGDVRVNQHTLVTVITTIWLRHHNRIATILKKLNAWWDEEKLFQETRRIVIAMMQCIVYKEYLPSILSSYWIDKYQLALSNGSTKYNPKWKPAIWVEFSTASFRVPHSTINSVVSTKPRNVTLGEELLRFLYSIPYGLNKGKIGGLVTDTTVTHSKLSDRYAVKDTNGYLYRSPGDDAGLDLSSVDIQRGRDNGLPTYVQIVYFCFKYVITEFEQLVYYKLMSESNMKVLKENYKDVRDVDMETGQQLEDKDNAVMGKTASCVVGIQFQYLMYGDRFHFQHANQSGSFTEAQREELKKTTWTQVICNNVEDIEYLPKNCMLMASAENPNVTCEEVGDLNYSLWKETKN